MDRLQAQAVIQEFLQPVFGFALKRCASIQDAEDLSQEIILRAYRALIHRDDVQDAVRYIWTIAHHMLANYYRDKQRRLCLSIDPGSLQDPLADLADQEDLRTLRQEIAYLSRTQRAIVIACYFEGRKQSEIAEAMGLPPGTVKWHLHEAKKELQSNMESIRPKHHLKFNPIRFCGMSTEGSLGEEGDVQRYFRSALAQNIAYVTWQRALTLHEIADALGVSPVYVESEAAALTEFGFLHEKKGRYRCAILLDEAGSTADSMKRSLLDQAARILAPAMLEALAESGLCQDGSLYAGCRDANFILWALLPYLLAQPDASGRQIPFDQAAVIRPDGGQNLLSATVSASVLDQPGVSGGCREDPRHIRWSGPCWNADRRITLWRFDAWHTPGRIGLINAATAQRELSLLRRFMEDAALSAEEYAFLAERGLIRTIGQPGALFQASLQPVWIRTAGLHQRLLALGQQVRQTHRARLDALAAPFRSRILEETPAHLRRAREYQLQSLYSSGSFIIRCMTCLEDAGRLNAPDDACKPALSTLIITE